MFRCPDCSAIFQSMPGIMDCPGCGTRLKVSSIGSVGIVWPWDLPEMIREFSRKLIWVGVIAIGAIMLLIVFR